MNKTTKSKQSVISFFEGAIVPYIPLLIANLTGYLHNYVTGVALAIISGILNVVYDVLIKKTPTTATTPATTATPTTKKN